MGPTEESGERAILVGKKPVMNYVLACLTAFQNGQKRVLLKARGHAISRAVDVALLTTERFSSGIAVSEIRIGTSDVKDSDSGESRTTSSIEISLTR